MCNPASMIMTKGHRTHWSEKTDSHHEIIMEFGLRETDARGAINIVPVEIVPPNGDMTKPLSKWKFTVDYAGFTRDLPEWFDAEKAEASTRAALKAWAKAKLIRSGTREKIETGQHYVCGTAVIESLAGDAEISIMHDSSQVKAMYDSSQVKAMHDSSQVKAMYDSSQVKAMYDSSQVTEMRGSSQVTEMHDSSQVTEVKGAATITVYKVCDPTCLKTKTAVMIDRCESAVHVYVGGKEYTP